MAGVPAQLSVDSVSQTSILLPLTPQVWLLNFFCFIRNKIPFLIVNSSFIATFYRDKIPSQIFRGLQGYVFVGSPICIETHVSHTFPIFYHVIPICFPYFSLFFYIMSIYFFHIFPTSYPSVPISFPHVSNIFVEKIDPLRSPFFAPLGNTRRSSCPSSRMRCRWSWRPCRGWRRCWSMRRRILRGDCDHLSS